MFLTHSVPGIVKNIISKLYVMLFDTFCNLHGNSIFKSDTFNNRNNLCIFMLLCELRREKTGFLHMRKQRRRSASR